MLRRIPLDNITRNPDQPRQHFDPKNLRELATSIRENGLIQPITVRPIEGGKYMIVAGERRYRAHCLLNEEGKLDEAKILAHVKKMDDDTMAVNAIIENLQRQDVRPMELSRALNALVERGHTEAQIGKMIGIKPHNVREKLSLVKLEEQAQQLVDSGQIAVCAGHQIAKLPDREQIKMVKRISSGKLNTYAEVRAAVEAVLDRLAQPDMMPDTPKASREDVATINRMEAKITQIKQMVAMGFKDNEVVVAKKVSPDRTRKMAEELGQLRSAIQKMERDLLLAASQSEITFEEAA